jgi:hypothetical protein
MAVKTVACIEGRVSLSTFLMYYGGKWKISRRYPPPRHSTIIEPFAGSAGYSVRYHNRRVVLVEKNPIVAGVWRYLLGSSPREILALPLLEHGQLIDGLALPQEAKWLLGFWVNDSVSSPCQQLSKWGIEKPDAHWGRTVRARLASQVDKIRHWQIIEGDYTAAPDVEATWFVDPPYQGMGKHYPHGADAIDFAALGAWCRSRRGQVIACENVGASWLPFRHFADAGSTAKDVSREAIWTNDTEAPRAEMR